jgi:hypothetical protein
MYQIKPADNEEINNSSCISGCHRGECKYYGLPRYDVIFYWIRTSVSEEHAASIFKIKVTFQIVHMEAGQNKSFL